MTTREYLVYPGGRIEDAPAKAEPAWVVSLDLGQQKDYTALSVIERTERDAQKALFKVKYLKRYPLGTPYTAVVTDVTAMLGHETLAGYRTSLVIDLTGVGLPVWDMFQAAGLSQAVYGITITGGIEVAKPAPGRYNVPKRDLVGIVQVLLQSRRLKVAEGLQEAATLVRELQNFQVKITESAHDTYGAWREGTHDDLVLSVAMGCWVLGSDSLNFWLEWA